MLMKGVVCIENDDWNILLLLSFGFLIKF